MTGGARGSGVSWVDGELHRAVVPVSDPGYTAGLGVFETLPAVDGRPQHLDAHLARLADGADRLGLTVPDPGRVRAGLREVVDACGAPLQRLRITLTGHLVLTAVPTEPWRGTMTALRSPWTVNERSPLAGIKATSYAHQTLALRQARARGADEALLTDTRGRLSEGTFTNLFLVHGGFVHTPSPDTGCLPGVMRALVLRWCADLGIGALQGHYQPDRLTGVDEVFLTNSMRGVVPVGSVDGVALPAPGPVTAALQAHGGSAPGTPG